MSWLIPRPTKTGKFVRRIEWQKKTHQCSNRTDLLREACDRQDRADPEVEDGPAADRAVRLSAASAILYAKRKSAGSAWTRRTSLTTRRPRFWRRSSRSAARFFRGA